MQKRMSRTSVIAIAVAAILLLCILPCGIVLAKYLIGENNSDGVVTANDYYFTSNFLDGKTHILAPDITSVTFTLSNHIDDLRYSDMDIKYTVTVTPAATIDHETGTLAKNDVNDAEITVSGLQEGKTYTVTAVGDGGYTTTLTATIEVPQKEAELYYYVDSSSGEYTLLTVWNEGDAEGTVTITYIGIPDNTNPDMNDWTASADSSDTKSQDVNIAPHASKTYRFFDVGNITVSGNVTVGELQ